MKTSAPAIIFVPGIRPKPPAEQQARELRRCFSYALKRNGVPEELANEFSAKLEVIGWSWHFYGVHKNIEEDREGIERLLTIVDDPIEVATESASFNKRIVKLLYAISDRFPRLSGLFATRRMETHLHEVRRYFRNQNDEADALRNLLKRRLRAAWNQQQPVILIGHSFGSVIAYDTLWQLSHEDAETGRVTALVTLGSPLTLRFIRRNLKGAKAVVNQRYPNNIDHWFNFAAVGEVAAASHRLIDCFSDMIASGAISTINDNLEIINQYRDADGLNVHKCYGYLASLPIAEQIFNAATQPSEHGESI